MSIRVGKFKHKVHTTVLSGSLTHTHGLWEKHEY